MKSFLDKLAVICATACGSGFVPKAPGTFGSLFAIPLIGLIQYFQWTLSMKLALIIAICALGVWSIARVESLWNTHDDGRIVIDEVAGMFLTLSWFPFDIFHVGLGFVFFRLFDIWKPGPVGYIDETWPGAYGTFFDDVAAGAFAGVCLLGVSMALT